MSRFLKVCLVLLVVLVLSTSAWAARCALCGAEIEDGQKYCERCKMKIEKERLTAKREKQIVDQLVKARKLYAQKLRELIQFYIDTGNYIKRKRAEQELAELQQVTKYSYVILSDLLGADVHPTKNIPEANKLYEDGLSYKNYPDLFTKTKRLKKAIQRFEELIRDYPESDKADDAAYMLAEIYAGFYFRDYLSAAKWYEKNFEWNPHTRYPSRYKAARVYDKHLHDYAKAVDLYDLVARYSPFPENREKARKRLAELRELGYIPVSALHKDEITGAEQESSSAETAPATKPKEQ